MPLNFITYYLLNQNHGLGVNWNAGCELGSNKGVFKRGGYNGGGATAIQGAKVVTVAGNSAIYNLAGQKVNASYKGIVIKDGKKYIQK